MQGNDFVQSVMYRHGVTCSSCHDVHGTANPAQLVAPADRAVPRSATNRAGRNGPRAKTIEAHTHHARGLAGQRSASRATCRRSSRRSAT